jgi:hypothetical protein
VNKLSVESFFSLPHDEELLPSDLCRFSYFSSCVGTSPEKDLDSIVRVAMQRNPLLGITGVISLENGLFHQILEGRFADLQLLMASISKDRRHHSLVLGKTRKIGSCSFSNWALHQISPRQMTQFEAT